MSEERWPVPEDWQWASVAEIATVIGGGTPDASVKTHFSEDGIPWITPADLTGYEKAHIGRGRRDLSEGGLASCSAKILPTGTVLFTTRAPIGYCAIAENEISTNQGFKNLILQGGILPEFIRYYLLSAKDYAESKASGTTFLELSGKRVSELSIPIAPIPEQKRIVKKIDELNSQISSAQKELDKIPSLLEKYRISLLRLAFEGRIDGRNAVDEDLCHDGSKQLWAVPNSWQWFRCDEVGSVGLGRQRSPKNHKGPNMRPYIRAANITWNGIDSSDVMKMNFTDAEFYRFKLEYGDVLLNEGSGSAKEVGKPAIWRNEIPNCCFQNTVLRVQPTLVSSEYLYYYFLFTALSGRFVSSAQGVNIQHIGKNGLGSYPVPVAPKKDQDRIVQFIGNAFSVLDSVSDKHDSAVALISDLNDSILKKAFRGQLVNQLPDEESAHEILMQISHQRAAFPKKLRKRKTKEAPMSKQPEQRIVDDSDSWPEAGLPYEEMAERISMPHNQMRDALFVLLAAENPKIRQIFDVDAERIVFKRALS